MNTYYEDGKHYVSLTDLQKDKFIITYYIKKAVVSIHNCFAYIFKELQLQQCLYRIFSKQQ